MSPALFQKSGKKTITSADWFLDPDELSSKFNSKTKAIIINTPNNPIGKVSTQQLSLIMSEKCKCLLTWYDMKEKTSALSSSCPLPAGFHQRGAADDC